MNRRTSALILSSLAVAAAPALALAVEGHGHHEPAQISNLLWPAVNFTIYALIIRSIFKKMVGPALLARAASFEQSFKHAAQVLEDAERELRQVQLRLKDIRKEQDALRERLSDEGSHIAGEVVAQAEQTAAGIRKDISRRIERELHVATSDVKQQVIRRATELARVELEKSLSEQDDYRLRQEAVKGLF